MPIRTLLAATAVALGATLSLAAPAQACTGTVCDAVNQVCVIVRGGECVR